MGQGDPIADTGWTSPVDRDSMRHDMITKDNQPRREESEMNKGFVVGPGKGKVWNMAPG